MSLCPDACPISACSELGSSTVELDPTEPYLLVLEGSPTDRRSFGLKLEP